MIVPVTDESAWLPHLAGLANWQPPWMRTVVLSPHPDDETLGAGGLIFSLAKRSVDLRIVAVTDGEHAYQDAVALGALREREQTAALERLGVRSDAIERLRLTDSGVSEQEEELVRRLAPLVDTETHLVAPWAGDFHPDHEACGRAAERVARVAGAKLTFYFFWTWHRGSLALLQELPLVVFPLSEDAQRARQQALKCHQSQLYREHGEPILPPHLLKPVGRNFEVYLPT